MTALQRKGTPGQYIRGLVNSWLGGLVGTLLVSFAFTYATRSLQEEPCRSGTISHINSNIVEMPWYAIFLRAMGCGVLVSFAMFLGT